MADQYRFEYILQGIRDGIKLPDPFEGVNPGRGQKQMVHVDKEIWTKAQVIESFGSVKLVIDGVRYNGFYSYDGDGFYAVDDRDIERCLSNILKHNSGWQDRGGQR